MSTDITTAAEFHLVDWWDKNKQRVTYVVIGAAVVALVVSFYLWRKDQNEVNASDALSAVEPGAGATQGYLKVAADYSGTAASARAVLFAANNAYAEGKMTEAQGLFERFLRDYPESQSRAAALLGVASCLDAQGKATDAATRYQEIIQRFAADPAAPAAKSALARLYETQNQLQPAMGLYQDLMRSEQNTSYGLESMVRLQNLLARHPELAKAAATNAVAGLPAK